MTRRKSELIEAAAAAWLVKQDLGTWRTGGQQEFEAWLNANTAHRVAFIRLEAAWKSSAVLQALRSQEGPDPEPIVRLFLESLATVH
jgi:transmembrane sensor